MKNTQQILTALGMPPSFKGYETIIRAVEVYPDCDNMTQVYSTLDDEIGNNKGCAERRYDML